MLTVTAEAHNSLLHLYLPADVAGVAAAAAARMLVRVCVCVCHCAARFPCTFYRQPSGGSHTTHGQPGAELWLDNKEKAARGILGSVVPSSSTTE